MNSPSRITLSRILAVNWYGYRQFIDVSGLTLITGANGSGKSALLDLIQFVMLGEQHSRFNKAAAGAGSGRTLRGYCLCDTNTTNRDGQERFLRPSGVTLAALEFTFPGAIEGGEPKRQTWGARIEYDSPTAKGTVSWFRVPGRLAREDFLSEDVLIGGERFLSSEEFRVHLKRDLDGDWWEHQRTYLEEMRLRSGLYFDREQMDKTLPKAMAFQPESHFEAFIRDYLLEAALPDVKAVKASVDAHRRAQQRLEKMFDQERRLTLICQCHDDALQHHREAGLWIHLVDALAHEQAKENLEGLRGELRSREETHAEQFEAREAAITERNELGEQLNKVMLSVGQDSQAAKLAEQREAYEKLKKEVTRLRESRQGASKFLQTHAMHWRNWLKHGESLGVTIPQEAQTQLAIVRGNDEARGLDAVPRLSREGDGLLHKADEKLRELRLRIESRESRERELVKDLEHFSAGRSAASPLLDALRSRGQKAVALGRVTEVKPEAEEWWPLLESLLGRDRQAILPEDFAAAWEEAQRTVSTSEPLIHPKEAQAKVLNLHKGSVRHFFETNHAAAGVYLDGLLGDLMPVDRVQHLDKYERTLSKDGWLKDPPRRERLAPAKELTLGEEGLRRLREVREIELRQIREELSDARAEQSDWKGWVTHAHQENLVNPDIPHVAPDLRRLVEVEKDLHTLEETIRLLATPEREAAVQNLRKLQASYDGAVERAARLDQKISHLDQEQRVLQDKIGIQEEAENGLMLQRQTSRAKLVGVLESELDDRINSARKEFPSWNHRREAAKEMVRQEEEKARAARIKRDQERRAFAEAHTDIADAFDPDDDSNDRYAARLRELTEQELERYTAEADRARQEWEERLQHQVLDLLRDKLNEADRTKRDLNRAMAHDIGGMRYQITSRKDRTHSAIWALIEHGLPSGNEMALFNHTQREEMEKAKTELMAAIEASDQSEDKRILRALDYRFYHHWDIEARPAGKGDEAAISLNKSAKKQSGGENQAPFFVATLAAFHRVYDVSTPNGPPTLGLVVMDEAFSKLSGDRIDDCLALARNFGLQLVMAFPEDRLPTMIEHAETVVQCRAERAYDDNTGAVSDIQNWVVRLNRDRLREPAP